MAVFAFACLTVGRKRRFTHEIVAGILIFFPPETDFLHEVKNSNSSLRDPSQMGSTTADCKLKKSIKQFMFTGKKFYSEF